jgi:hypothetical protein
MVKSSLKSVNKRINPPTKPLVPLGKTTADKKATQKASASHASINPTDVPLPLPADGNLDDTEVNSPTTDKMRILPKRATLVP